MNTPLVAETQVENHRRSGPRAQLLDGIPVTERTIDAAGIPTVVLEGGEGPPMVLLHGPGEFAPKWFRVLPELVKDYRVLAPDLPAHGESGGAGAELDEERMTAWLGALIDATCETAPILVGHVIGGAIAIRYVLQHADRVAGLVLIDSLGLMPFRPTPRFLLHLVHFMARPSERTYDRFMRQCSADLDLLRDEMGERWAPFQEYQLSLAKSSASKSVGRMIRAVGVPQIAPEDLARISVPTSLIWGRLDRANRVSAAEDVSERYGWPLYVIENCADDPPRDRPEAFLAALRKAMQY